VTARHALAGILALVLLGAGLGVWLLIQPPAAPFIAPSAEGVRVAEQTFGVREISYRVMRPADGWQTQVMQRLRASGWRLAGDRYAWGDTERYIPTYTRVSRVWFVQMEEQAQLLGSREFAIIKLERRMTLRWRW
jgi:hypothetical protein